MPAFRLLANGYYPKLDREAELLTPRVRGYWLMFLGILNPLTSETVLRPQPALCPSWRVGRSSKQIQLKTPAKTALDSPNLSRNRYSEIRRAGSERRWEDGVSMRCLVRLVEFQQPKLATEAATLIAWECFGS